MRQQINCCEIFFVSVIVPRWCFGVEKDTLKHTHPHTFTLIPLFSLLTLHHHANPACFTRQETEKLIVIPQVLADLSQICLCHAPHSTSFLYCLPPRNLKISHLWDLLEMWEICKWSLLPGEFLSRTAGKSKGKRCAKMERETLRGKLYSAASSWGLQGCSNIERKCLAKQGLVFVGCHVSPKGRVKTVAGYLLEGSMCLSLNDQNSSISDALSLPVYLSEARAALICFRRQYPTQWYLCSVLRPQLTSLFS